MAPMADEPAALPSYDELPVVPGAPPGSSWGLWEDAAAGALSLLTPSRVRGARSMIRSGRVFPLDLDISAVDPPLFGRAQPRHEFLRYPSGGLDDLITDWNTQASTQWDGFRHQVHPQYGYYGGTEDGHGIDKWAARGIVGRAVLLDLVRWRVSQGLPPVRHGEREVTGPDELSACRAHQGTAIQPGDILLVRTGWLDWYRSLDASARRGLAAGAGFSSSGLAASMQMARLLWDWHISAVAADNPSLEAWPRMGEEFLHHHLLNLLGIPVGELWALDELAGDCAADGSWDAFLTSAPMRIRGSVGSPANAIAVR
jgi:kynurenine formamidase